MINIDELATYFDKTFFDYDPHEYRDADFSVEQAKQDITERPLVVIENLLTIINELIQ